MDGKKENPVKKVLSQIIRLDQVKSVSEMRKIITEILELLGTYAEADRVYFFERDRRSNLFLNTYEWRVSEKIKKEKRYCSVAAYHMPYWMSMFQAGETIVIRDREEIRKKMPKEYAAMKRSGVETEVAIPLFVRDELRGFIGMDNPESTISEVFIQQIAFVGAHIFSARTNLEMFTELNERQKELEDNLLRVQREQQVLKVLCADSTSVFRVNLRTDIAEVVKIDLYTNAATMIFPNKKETHLAYFKEMKSFYDRFVVKKSAPDYLQIFEPNHLMEILKTREKISMKFQMYPNLLGQQYFEIRATRMHRSEEEFIILLDFRSIDEIVMEERRNQIQLETALTEMRMSNEILSAISKIYVSIYKIHLCSNYYEEVCGENHLYRPTGRHGNAREKMREICEKEVAAEYRERAFEFLELDTLAERLGEEESAAVEYLATDGNWHLIRFVVQKRDKDGVAEEVLCVVRIISEEKRREKYWIVAAEEANRANQEKSEFLSRISHDIRTPMNVIMGFVSIAKLHLTEPDKLEDYLEKIEMSGKNLQQLVNDVLDISHIESGNLVLSKEPIDIEKLFSFHEQTIVGADRTKKQQFVFKKHDILHPVLLADGLRISQIYTNLLSNAVKYTPSEGTITFELYEKEVEGQEVELVAIIQDTGIGMTEEFMEKMYSQFSRAIDTRVNSVRGSGLGLSIVKKLVDLMDGTIEVTSKLQKGTTFRVTLKLPYVETMKIEEPKEERYLLKNRTINLLVAEDNDLNYEVLEEQLKEKNISCVRAKNGRECVEIFEHSKAGKIDAILMDMQMPILNGLGATSRIRSLSHPRAKDIPIIAVTANAYQEDVNKCLEAGMNDHLSKPIDIDRLIQMILEYMR